MNRPAPFRLALISDIHYAGAAEAARQPAMFDPISSPLRRQLVRLYRRHLWLHDPCAHNHLLDRFLSQTANADLVVANGDFSCDSAYIGVSDDAACASATECLAKLRATFPGRFHATFGDHELGKKMLAANVGGLRLASYHRAEQELGLQPFWQWTVGRYVLMGIVSTLVALPVYEAEALAEEKAAWRKLRAAHLEQIRAAFAALQPDQRVLLFCHDPTALPFLAREDAVRAKLPQIERTIIGHLHSPLILRQSALLSGLPAVPFLGHTIRRVTAALHEARHWHRFNILLCPSPAGIQLRKDGGYYTAEIDPAARQPARFLFHPLGWS